jgi:hypothetical protein
MGDRRIILKNLRTSSFNKDLSNEPNFGRIHLAGQYLYCFFSKWWFLSCTHVIVLDQAIFRRASRPTYWL